MNLIATFALLAWPLAAIGLIAWLRGARGVVAACIVGWLFLPEGGIDFEGPFDASKANMISLGLLLGVLLFDSSRLTRFRPRLVDLPVAVLCLSSMLSSVDNGLGVYDGFSETVRKVLIWGVPWLIGRACFTTAADLRALVMGVILGGLAYLPLCLYEVRMSPQLHNMVYGYFPHVFAQTYRFGGYRPNVFMQHGLMVGLWMCLSALAGGWMWQRGRLRAVLGVPISLVVPAQIVVAILCKSVGAILVGGGGWALLTASALLRTRILLLCLALAAPAYVGYRVIDAPTTPFVDLVRSIPVVSQRADSFAYRLKADGILLDHARRRPLFGWGGQNRHRPLNEEGYELARTDSLWIIVLGQNGVVGLVGLYAMLFLPLWTVARRVPAAGLFSAQGAPLLIAASMIGLYACDSLFNAMVSPVYLMSGGAALSVVASLRRAARAAAARPGASPKPLAGGGASDFRARDAAEADDPDAASRSGVAPRLIVADAEVVEPPPVHDPMRVGPVPPSVPELPPPLRLRVPPADPAAPGTPDAPGEPPDRLSIPWRAPRS